LGRKFACFILQLDSYSIFSLLIQKSQKIAKNVNGDEAAVLGAAFRGASLSTQFRLTKNIAIKDITLFPIDIIYKADTVGEEGKRFLFTIKVLLN
jgi:molecular chaperone DnaK (HSP70)